MRKLYGLLLIGLTAFALMLTFVFLTGPRMLVQPNLRTFRAPAALPPSNSVPVQVAAEPLPTADEARTLTNPVPDTAGNRRRGRVYYEYYCLACHGTAGDGAGPVGESYVPVPADLRVRVPQIPGDGELLRRMLTGTGHAPVLERVIAPEERWYLVRYVRQFGAPPSPPPRE